MSCQSNSDQPISFGIDYTSSFLARQQKDALLLHQQLQKEIEIIQNRNYTSGETIPTVSSKNDFNNTKPLSQNTEEPTFVSFNQQPSQVSYSHLQNTFPSEIDSVGQFDTETRTQLHHIKHDFTAKPGISQNSNVSWSFPQQLSKDSDQVPIIRVHKNHMDLNVNNYQSKLSNDNNSEIEKYMSKTYYQLSSQTNNSLPKDTQQLQAQPLQQQDGNIDSKQKYPKNDFLTKKSNLLFPQKTSSRQEYQAPQCQEVLPSKIKSNSFEVHNQYDQDYTSNIHETPPSLPCFKQQQQQQQQQYSTCYSPYSTLDTTERLNYNTIIENSNNNTVKVASFCESQKSAMKISLGKLNLNQFKRPTQEQSYFGFQSLQEQKCQYINQDEGINQHQKDNNNNIYNNCDMDNKISNRSNDYQLELRTICNQNQESPDQQQLSSKELFRRSDAGIISNAQSIQTRSYQLQNYLEDQLCNSQLKEINQRSNKRIIDKRSTSNKIEKSSLNRSTENIKERYISKQSFNGQLEQTDKNQGDIKRINECSVDINHDDNDNLGYQKENNDIINNLDEEKKLAEFLEIQKQNEDLLRKQEELEQLVKRYESEMKIKDQEMNDLKQAQADLIEKNDQLIKQNRKSENKILLLVEEQEKLLDVCERKDIEAEEQYKQLYLWKDRANNIQKEQSQKIADETKYAESLREQQQVQCEFIKQLTQQLQILQNLTPPIQSQSTSRGSSLKHKNQTDYNILQQQIQEKNSENALLKTFVESSASNKIIQELLQKMKYLSLENERLNKLIISRCMHMRKNW